MRVRMALAVATPLLLTAGAVRTAEAQASYALCTGAPSQSCAWIQVATAAGGPGMTQLTIRAQNLQGIAGGGTTGPSVLDRIFLNFMTPLVPTGASGMTSLPSPSAGVPSYVGTGDLAGAVPAEWSYFEANSMFPLALVGDNPLLSQFTDILGCDGPSPFEDPGFQTCGQPGDEWVEMMLELDGTFDESQLASVGFGVRYGILPGEEHVCNDAPNANTTCRLFQQSVVPEPATVLLLGSGLGVLGIGALRRRQRRLPA